MSLTETGILSQPRAGKASQGTAKQRSSHRGRGARLHGGGSGQTEKAIDKVKDSPILPPEETKETATSLEVTEATDEMICWICAEPVKYYSVSACNHRTCHVCALRLRALYKKTDCAFCKEPQPLVIFTTSPDALFASYALESMVFKDVKLSISFESHEMMEETLLLLRFNCPDPDCAYIGNGWGDLKLHVRAIHGKLMCDLCIRSKKVFTHEHALYPPNLLPVHLPSMYHRHGKTVSKDQIEGGIHPLCEFCRECFFGDDELFAHMRERHEECFVCKRNDVRDQYFQNYESLENHFNSAHHPCAQPSCLARKFVVFNTPLDLKAHMVDEHGGDMSSRDKKDARRIIAEFEFEEVGIGGRHGRRDRNHRARDREPPTQQWRQQVEHPPPPATAPSNVVPPPGLGRRREGFGPTLAVEGNRDSSHTASRRSRSLSPRGDLDPVVSERHAMFIARLQSLAPNSTNAVAVVKAAIRGYRALESSARDLILNLWNVLDQNLDHTASIVNALVDLFDEEDKKQDLLASWKGFTVEQRREFPNLIPITNSSGYAAITSGQVLNAKHVTSTRSQRSSRLVWDRVAQAAGSPSPSSQFPTVLSSTSSSQPASRPTSSSYGFRPAVATANQSITMIRDDSQAPKPVSGKNVPKQAPPKLSNTLFPELPTSTTGRPKAPISGNSLRSILGNAALPSTPAWGHGGANANGSASEGDAGAENGDGKATSTVPSGKGKKGKGKQKQTLFTLGSFPT